MTRIMRDELKDFAETLLDTPIGAHTAARVNGDQWTFSREELVDLLTDFGVNAVVMSRTEGPKKQVGKQGKRVMEGK